MRSGFVWAAACVAAAALGAVQPLARANESTPSAPMPMKDFDCGSKGQKLCPMQAWMKTVMAAAAGSGDGAKLASALAYVAARPPPGMPEWVALSNDGAAKAKAGDIDGAKVSCKKCHDLYKATYKETLRDRPF